MPKSVSKNIISKFQNEENLNYFGSIQGKKICKIRVGRNRDQNGHEWTLFEKIYVGDEDMVSDREEKYRDSYIDIDPAFML